MILLLNQRRSKSYRHQVQAKAQISDSCSKEGNNKNKHAQQKNISRAATKLVRQYQNVNNRKGPCPDPDKFFPVIDTLCTSVDPLPGSEQYPRLTQSILKHFNQNQQERRLLNSDIQS